MRMRKNGRKATYGIKFDHKFDFSVSDFLYDEKCSKSDDDFIYFSQFSAAHEHGKRARILHSVKFLTPKFEISMSCFLFEYELYVL